MEDLAFPFLEFHKDSVDPFLQPLEVPLNGSTPIWCITYSSQFCVICKLAKDVLCPIIQVINEDVGEY